MLPAFARLDSGFFSRISRLPGFLFEDTLHKWTVWEHGVGLVVTVGTVAVKEE